MLDHVAEVDEPLLFHIVHNAPAANSTQTMLSVADGQRAVPPAVDDEAGRADQVHPLEERRAAGQPAERHQDIGGEDQRRAGPAGDLDRDVGEGQAAAPRARFRST